MGFNFFYCGMYALMFFWNYVDELKSPRSCQRRRVLGGCKFFPEIVKNKFRIGIGLDLIIYLFCFFYGLVNAHFSLSGNIPDSKDWFIRKRCLDNTSKDAFDTLKRYTFYEK